MIKRLTVLLYGGDRQLWRGKQATVTVRDLTRSDRALLLPARKISGAVIEITLEGLAFDAGQVYGLTIEAPKHRTIGQLIRRQTFLKLEGDRLVERDEALFRLMLLPNKRVPVGLESSYSALHRAGSPFVPVYIGEVYETDSDAQKMAFLNIEAKCRATYVGTNAIATYVTAIQEVLPDRLFILAHASLKDVIARSPEWAAAPGHPHHPDSWKHTRYEFGNLQLSFSSDSGGHQHAVDVDIDLARGLGHVGEWLDNNVLRRGQKTDQTLVYALLFAQGVLPVYTIAV